MRRKIDRFLIKSLRREKKSRLSVFEKTILYIAGRRDGLHGLPNVDNEGNWTSPIIQKEINSSNESFNRIYGTLQICLGEKYKEAAVLADRLEHYRDRVDTLMKEYPCDLTEEECHIRKHGEEKLTDQQIRNRRLAECSREREKVQEKIDAIEAQYEKEFEELVELNNYLIQKNYETDIVCERIRCHTQQRIDYYWNIAKHIAYENNREMPTVFTQLRIPDVIENYKKIHQAEEEKIQSIIFGINGKKEAA